MPRSHETGIECEHSLKTFLFCACDVNALNTCIVNRNCLYSFVELVVNILDSSFKQKRLIL